MYRGERAIELIIKELYKAEVKFPGWPEDPVHAAAILAEEAGELVKAALDYYYGRHEGIDQMEKEAAQTGAMALRFLMGLEQEFKPMREATRLEGRP
jgi:NTP pyrophosphatase (non-canonical NTP hydrolase)